MLHTISWTEYFTLMGLVFLLYYGWWLVRFYPTLRIGGADKAGQGRQVLAAAARAAKRSEAGKPAGVEKREEDGQAAPVEAAGEVIGEPDQAGAAVSSPLKELPAVSAGSAVELPFPAVVDKPLLLPVVAGDLWNEVKTLVLKASEAGMVEGELVFAFQQLLKKEPFNRLRGTHFEKKISEQIVSELERHGPVRVDVVVVSGWWK